MMLNLNEQQSTQIRFKSLEHRCGLSDDELPHIPLSSVDNLTYTTEQWLGKPLLI